MFGKAANTNFGSLQNVTLCSVQVWVEGDIYGIFSNKRHFASKLLLKWQNTTAKSSLSVCINNSDSKFAG